MAIAPVISVDYVSDGVTTDYVIPFTYQNDDDIEVTSDGLAVAFTIHPTLDVVQLAAPAPVGAIVRVFRNTDVTTMPFSFVLGAPFTKEYIDSNNNLLLQGIQENADGISRVDELIDLALQDAVIEAEVTNAIRAPTGEVLPVLPGPTARANKTLKFDTNGDPVVVTDGLPSGLTPDEIAVSDATGTLSTYGIKYKLDLLGQEYLGVDVPNGAVTLQGNANNVYSLGAITMLAHRDTATLNVGDRLISVADTLVSTAFEIVKTATGYLATGDGLAFELSQNLIQELQDVSTDAPNLGEALVWNGSAWVNQNVERTGARDEASTSGTSVVSDSENMVAMTNAAANTFTITNAAHSVNDKVHVLQAGAGQTTIALDSGTLRFPAGLTAKLTEQWSVVTIWKRTSTEWVLFGDLEAAP